MLGVRKIAGVNGSLLTHLYKEEVYQFSTPVIVVLARPWMSYSTDAHAMLHRMLGAVKLSPGHVRVLTRPTLDLKSLTHFTPRRVLIFGSTVDEEIPLYQDTSAVAFRVVRAEDLDALDDQKKKILWAALKQMFGL